MRKIIYPGMFDPIHNGHMDIAERASKLFDELLFVVAVNPAKEPLFNADERMDMIRESVIHLDNVSVTSSGELIAEFARDEEAVALIRGLRHVSDFEFEFQMAMMNYHLNPEITTIFMMPGERYIHLNSTVVKDVASLKGNIVDYVPDAVYLALKSKFSF